MNWSWLILVGLLFTLSAQAQTTPPPGVVIPFDEDEVSSKPLEKPEKSKKKKETKASKASKNAAPAGVKPSFLQTAKPRKPNAVPNKESAGREQSGLGQPINTQSPKAADSKRQINGIPEGTKLVRARSNSATKSKNIARDKTKKNRAKKNRAKKNRAKKKKAKKNRAKKKKAKKNRAKKNRAKKKKAIRRRPQSTQKSDLATIHPGATTVGRGRRKALTGMGLLQTFDTPFGRLGTVSHHQAERVRERLMGRTVLDPNVVLFEQGNYQLMRRYASRIAALTDYVNATPSVLTVFVVGHADDSTTPTESALLSAARASAVAQALVAKGVSAKRILAFGADRHFPASTDSTENRRVHFEFIHKTVPLLKQSTMLTTASIVRFSGLGTVKDQKGVRSANAPMTLSAGSELTIDTGEAALVLPSGRLITVNEDTKLGIETVRGNLKTQHSHETIALHQGSIRVSSPTSRVAQAGSGSHLQSKFTVKSSGYSIQFFNASGTVNTHAERLVLTLDTGRVTALLQSGLSISLTAGQSLVKDTKGIAIHRRLPRPTRLRPRVTNPKKQVQWVEVPNAVSYVLEVSSRIDFDWDIKRVESTLPIFDIESLSNRGQWYLRVHAVDRFGTMGEASQTIMGTGSTAVSN